MKKIIVILALVMLFSQAKAQYGWYDQKSGVKVFLYNACFVNNQYGWIVGDMGVVLNTYDGGKHWDEQQSNTKQWLQSVYFIDSDYGWAVGDFARIISTTDGGGKWTIQNKKEDKNGLTSVYFTDKNYGWATGGSGLQRTTNGGNEWLSMASSTFTGNRGVCFANPAKGWAVGNNGAVLQSLDSGKTWKSQNSGVKGIINGIYFKNENEGWLLHKDEPKLLKTSDGGTTWIPASKPVKGAYTGFSIVEDTLVWFAGQSGIAYSKDGGKKWKNQTPLQNPNMWTVRFTDKKNGWAVGSNGAILHTTNSGKVFNIDFTATPTVGVVPYSTTFTNLTTSLIDVPLTYKWDFGDGYSRSIKEPIHTYSTSGTFTVVLTVSDGTFTDTETKEGYITVRKPFEADFTGNPLLGKGPMDVQFNDQSIGTVSSWNWDFGDGGYSTDRNPKHTYTEYGYFDVKLVVSNGKITDSLRKVKYVLVNDPGSVTEIVLFNASLSNYPNPFDGSTEIKYTLKDYGKVRLIVYNILGTVEAELINSYQPGGDYSIIWNGINRYGKQLPTGNYFYRLTIESGDKLLYDNKVMIIYR